LAEDLKRAILLEQVTASRSFVSRAGYRHSLLALVQAVAWLGEESSILSGERKERESCCEEKQVLDIWGDGERCAVW
jgi:hypothetical protein